MATTRQSISVGTNANDGTGDTLRSAGQKINANFGQIYARLGGDSDNFSSQVSLVDSAVEFKPGANAVYLSSIPTLTGDRDIQLPDASGIITLNEASQTLTSKNITMTRTILDNTDVGSASDSPIPDTTNQYIRATGTGYQVTLQDGNASDIGTMKVFTYTGTGILQVTATGGNFDLEGPNNRGMILIWDGSQWIQLTQSDTDT